MDEDGHPTILPPPPSARVAVWAMINELWFRCVQRCWRRYRRALRSVPRGPQLLGPGPRPSGSMARLARQGRLSSLMGRLATERGARVTVQVRPRPRVDDGAPSGRAGHCPKPRCEERPTSVDVRRAPLKTAHPVGARPTPVVPHLT